MAEKSRNKVAVLEGDYAELCGLGLPLPLSVQLQLSSSGALWSVKASGFSVSLYWPTADTTHKVAEKAKKARKKHKRKCKQAPGSVSNNETTSPTVPVLAAQSNLSQLPNNDHPSPDNIDALDTNPSDSPGLVHHSGVAQCSVTSLSPTVSDDSPTGSLDCDSPAVDSVFEHQVCNKRECLTLVTAESKAGHLSLVKERRGPSQYTSNDDSHLII